MLPVIATNCRGYIPDQSPTNVLLLHSLPVLFKPRPYAHDRMLASLRSCLQSVNPHQPQELKGQTPHVEHSGQHEVYRDEAAVPAGGWVGRVKEKVAEAFQFASSVSDQERHALRRGMCWP